VTDLAPIALIIPGSIDTPTGGYRYDRRIVAELRARGHDVDVVELSGRFPQPSVTEVDAALALIAGCTRGRVLLVDGLVYSATSAIAAGLARLDRPLIALIHHPLALEAGLLPEAAKELHAAERAALALAGTIIVTSPETQAILERDFGVMSSRVSIALPGVDRPTAPERERTGRLHLLTVASFIPRKGYLDLIAAYAEIADLDWRATLIGGMSFDPPYVARVREAITAANLTGRIRMLGVVDQSDLERHYADADLFVLATHYEGYGMVFGEAMVHGLGVIGTTGALSSIGDGGDTVEPGDVAALAGCLRRALVEPDGLVRLQRMAAARAAQLPDWRTAAETFAEAIRRFMGAPSASRLR
jgi:glycosyltransferase involved in cell wall biosynthesis